MVVPGHELLQLARDSKEETKEMLTQESLGRGIVYLSGERLVTRHIQTAQEPTCPAAPAIEG